MSNLTLVYVGSVDFNSYEEYCQSTKSLLSTLVRVGLILGLV